MLTLAVMSVAFMIVPHFGTGWALARLLAARPRYLPYLLAVCYSWLGPQAVYLWYYLQSLGAARQYELEPLDLAAAFLTGELLLLPVLITGVIVGQTWTQDRTGKGALVLLVVAGPTSWIVVLALWYLSIKGG